MKNELTVSETRNQQVWGKKKGAKLIKISSADALTHVELSGTHISYLALKCGPIAEDFLRVLLEVSTFNCSLNLHLQSIIFALPPNHILHDTSCDTFHQQGIHFIHYTSMPVVIMGRVLYIVMYIHHYTHVTFFFLKQ